MYMFYNKKVFYWWGKPKKKINFWVTSHFIVYYVDHNTYYKYDMKINVSLSQKKGN